MYVLTGVASRARNGSTFEEGQLAVFGPGEAITMRAAAPAGHSEEGWDVLLLGGRALREPVARYGPFVMNTREEIVQAMDDYRAGRLGSVPAVAG